MTKFQNKKLTELLTKQWYLWKKSNHRSYIWAETASKKDRIRYYIVCRAMLKNRRKVIRYAKKIGYDLYAHHNNPDIPYMGIL